MNDESLLHRAKAHLPLYQLQDRLDYKQALIEIAMGDPTIFLDRFSNSIKSTQIEVIESFWNSQSFLKKTGKQLYIKGQWVTVESSNLEQVIGYKEQLNILYNSPRYSNDFAELCWRNHLIQKTEHLKAGWSQDYALAKSLNDPQYGIFNKTLSHLLENDCYLAIFILKTAPDFPSELPEIDSIQVDKLLPTLSQMLNKFDEMEFYINGKKIVAGGSQQSQVLECFYKNQTLLLDSSTLVGYLKIHKNSLKFTLDNLNKSYKKATGLKTGFLVETDGEKHLLKAKASFFTADLLPK